MITINVSDIHFKNEIENIKKYFDVFVYINGEKIKIKKEDQEKFMSFKAEKR